MITVLAVIVALAANHAKLWVRKVRNDHGGFANEALQPTVV